MLDCDTVLILISQRHGLVVRKNKGFLFFISAVIQYANENVGDIESRRAHARNHDGVICGIFRSLRDPAFSQGARLYKR